MDFTKLSKKELLHLLESMNEDQIKKSILNNRKAQKASGQDQCLECWIIARKLGLED